MAWTKPNVISGEPMTEPGRIGFCSARGSPQLSPRGVPDSHTTLRRSRTRFNSWQGHFINDAEARRHSDCLQSSFKWVRFPPASFNAIRKEI